MHDSIAARFKPRTTQIDKDNATMIFVCPNKPNHPDHRIFLRLDQYDILTENCGLLQRTRNDAPWPNVICTCCGAFALKLHRDPVEPARTHDGPANYTPNTRHWAPGDLVIHDVDPKRKSMLMVVCGYTQYGKVRTRYVYETADWWIKTRGEPEIRKANEFYENEIGLLHAPSLFDEYTMDVPHGFSRTFDWLTDFPEDDPDHNYDPVFSVYDLKYVFPANHAVHSLPEEITADQIEKHAQRLKEVEKIYPELPSIADGEDEWDDGEDEEETEEEEEEDEGEEESEQEAKTN